MKLFVAASLLLSLSAQADIFTEKLTCKIDGKTGIFAGGGSHYSRPMTEEECFQLGADAFNATVETGLLIINPLNNTVTERKFTTQNKRVKATYITENGKSSKTLKRNKVEKKLVSEKITKVESGFRCWTQAECIAVEN